MTLPKTKCSNKLIIWKLYLKDEKNDMKQNTQFRDVFNIKLVQLLATDLSQAWVDFDKSEFINSIEPSLDELNFGQRSSLIADKLREFLPDNFESAVKILVKALGPEDKSDAIQGFDGFIIMPQCLFISRYGLDFPNESLNALYEMTKRFTAEGDIRPFIEKYPKQTMTFLEKLTRDKSPFARRLPSEGTRPRLPLSSRLAEFQKDPTPVIKLLDKLYCDPNLMVRRSVANNLNDIAKDNPDIVVKTLERWRNESPSTELEWIISHASRTLIKQGHHGALKLQGFNPKVHIHVSDIELNKAKLAFGDELTFMIRIDSLETKTCKLMIDYVIHFMKANGKQSPKVFKAARKTLDPKSSVVVTKQHSFQQRTSRIHYPGAHLLEIQINGRRYSQIDFDLVAE